MPPHRATVQGLGALLQSDCAVIECLDESKEGR
jgi:hypothetical protein